MFNGQLVAFCAFPCLILPVRARDVNCNELTVRAVDTSRKSMYVLLVGHLGLPCTVTQSLANEYSDFGPIERYISETVQDRS